MEAFLDAAGTSASAELVPPPKKRWRECVMSIPGVHSFKLRRRKITHFRHETCVAELLPSNEGEKGDRERCFTRRDIA